MNIDRHVRLEEVAGPVSRETLTKLIEFEALFQKWAARINLAASSTLHQLWERHVLDSAQLLKIKPAALRWLDLGSGGGFPGAVVAILLGGKPGAMVHLIESNKKKAAFLNAAMTTLQAPAQVHAIRIEDAYATMERPEIVTARALASLPVLLDLAGPWLSRGSTGLFHKGRDYLAEVAKSADGRRFRLVEHRSFTDPSSMILEISDLARVS